MSNRNERFKAVLDWLYENGKVSDQRELSEMTGITETTISRILHEKVRQPSEDTLRKLNGAFGNMFNMQFFRCESDDMIIDEPKDESSPESSIIELAATLIKENEAFRRQLTDAISEVRTLREEMARDRDALMSIRSSLSAIYPQFHDRLPVAAEETT